ncbi:MAG: sugar phosphate isomerase/epimerase [Candidatus Aenigmarchaeota archaeon]|nr:sugar phosphate isomerase/epimerase [Candidatus Aenigmarchaeota archaeon]
MLKIALFTNAFSFCLPPSEAEKWTWSEKMAEYISSLGFNSVEISVKRHMDLEKVFSGDADKVRNIARRYDLEIVALASHYNHLDTDLDKRKLYNEKFLKAIEAAALLDVPVVVTFSGSPYPFNYFYPYPESNIDKIEEAWNEFKEVWNPLVDYARQHSVKIAIEPHFGQLVFNTQTINRMFKEVSDKTLGLNFDPSHIVWQLMDPIEIIERLGDRIYHTHIKDVEFINEKLRENGILAIGKWASSERSWRFRIPGKGVIEWHRLLNKLFSKGYRGALSFEHEDPLASLEEGSKNTVTFIKKVLQEIGFNL